MLTRLTKLHDIQYKSDFNMESLRFFFPKVPEGQPDDLVTNIGH